jgi:hypothetical protein
MQVVVLLVLLSLFAISLEVGAAPRKPAVKQLDKVNMTSYWARYELRDMGPNISMSYLWSEEDIMTDPRISFMNKIVRILHAIQHPPENQCKHRKLMVLQMKGNSFEGTGSLLKQILLGIAIAAHSDRTLVWGLGLPYIYEHSQDVWQGENNHNVQFHADSISVDCSNPDPTGGAYKCFFEPMSGCTLADASASEIISYSMNCYNDTDRLMVGEVSRRGVALFHPPEGLYDYVLTHQVGELGKGAQVRPEDIAGLENNLWVAAVAAYVFRLKPSVVSQYLERYEKDFGRNAPRPLWGFHIRHGDLKAMPKMYRYKTVFSFDEFFAVARDMSHVTKTMPSRLFLSSDDPDIHHIDDMYRKFAMNTSWSGPDEATTESDIVESKSEEDDDDDLYYDDVDLDKKLKPKKSTSKKSSRQYQERSQSSKVACSSLKSASDIVAKNMENIDTMRVPEYDPACRSWYAQDKHPHVFSVGNSHRYRTVHGSHTVAANGGCQKDENYDKRGMKCSLEFDMITQYQTNETHLAVPRANRIFRAYAESLEDIYLLSQSDVFFGQGSSYFSTLASYLVWARTGCKDFQNSVVFLDLGHVAEGLHPTAHLHGMNLINSTYGLDPQLVPNAGMARWKIHTDNFLPALQSYAQGQRLDFNPWDPKNYMRLDMKTLLPQLPDYFFYKEARAWRMSRYKSIWPGSCPGPKKPDEFIDTYVLETSNMGNAMHDATLPGQALQCWKDARIAVEAEFSSLRAAGDDPASHIFLSNAYDVLKGNIKSLMLMSYADLVISENVRDYFHVDMKKKKPLRPALLPPGFMDESETQPMLGHGEPQDKFAAMDVLDFESAIDWVQIGENKRLVDAAETAEEIDRILGYLNAYVRALNEKKRHLAGIYENEAVEEQVQSVSAESEELESTAAKANKVGKKQGNPNKNGKKKKRRTHNFNHE